MAKVTFGKFEGSLNNGRTKEFFVDGVCAGYIEAEIGSKGWNGQASGNSESLFVGGYSVVIFGDAEALGPSGSAIEQQFFDKLANATAAVRKLFEL